MQQKLAVRVADIRLEAEQLMPARRMQRVRALTRQWLLLLLLDLEHYQTVDDEDFGANSPALQRFFGNVPRGADNRGSSRQVLKRHFQSIRRRLDVCATSIVEPLFPELGAFAERMGLDDAETRVLSVLTTRDLDANFKLLLRKMSREDVPPDVYLALAIWTGLGVAAVRSALSHTSSLVRFGIVLDSCSSTLDIEESWAVEPRLLNLLAEGGYATDQLMSFYFHESSAATLTLADYPHLASLPQTWLGYLRHVLAHRRSGANLLVYGQPGTGKTEFVRALAAAAGASLVEINTEDGDGDPLCAQRILGACRLTQTVLKDRGNTVVLLDEADALLQPPEHGLHSGRSRRNRGSFAGKSWMTGMLEQNQLPTIWIANAIDGFHDAYLRRFDLILAMPEPPVHIKRKMLDRHLGTLPISAPLRQSLSELAGLQPGHAAALARMVATLPEEVDADAAASAQVNALQTVLGLPGLPKPSSPMLGEYQLAWLNPDRPLQPIIDRIVKTGQGRFCLYGPPGTGKTAFAAALSKRLQRPLRVMRGADLLSKWVGEAEKNIAAAFRDAEAADAVLVIDEVEGMLGQRSEGQQRWEISQVNEMLTSLENYLGVVVLTTNMVEMLDPAMLRRVEYKIQFRALDSKQRRSLWAHLCVRFDWPPCDVLGAHVDQLDGLTAGDFEVVARQFAHDAETNTAIAFVEALRAEHRMKRVRRPMGFAS